MQNFSKKLVRRFQETLVSLVFNENTGFQETLDARTDKHEFTGTFALKLEVQLMNNPTKDKKHHDHEWIDIDDDSIRKDDATSETSIIIISI